MWFIFVRIVKILQPISFDGTCVFTVRTVNDVIPTLNINDQPNSSLSRKHTSTKTKSQTTIERSLLEYKAKIRHPHSRERDLCVYISDLLRSSKNFPICIRFASLCSEKVLNLELTQKFREEFFSKTFFLGRWKLEASSSQLMRSKVVARLHFKTFIRVNEN